MTAIYCQECGRANGEAAKRCLWCGVPIVDRSSPHEFAPTRIEIDYLRGIERLDESVTVRMVISRAGIEVSETVPGSRTFKIPASEILGANARDASTDIEPKQTRSPRWRLAFVPFARVSRDKMHPDNRKHDYLLEIRYKLGSETRIAVFHSEDRAGLPAVELLARTITTLVRLEAQGSGG